MNENYLESKRNLVTLRKCNSHLQYYKIDLSFRIKLQEINLYVCEEYKTEREARRPNRALKLANNENVPPRRADFWDYHYEIKHYEHKKSLRGYILPRISLTDLPSI